MKLALLLMTAAAKSAGFFLRLAPRPAACALLTAAALLPHDLYFLPQRFAAKTGDQILISVHSGDAFPHSEEGPDPARFVAPRLIGPTGETPLSEFRAVGNATLGVVKVEHAGGLWLALSTKPRNFELPAGRFEDYLKEEGFAHVARERAKSGRSANPGRERYSKYAKSLIVNGAADARTLRKPVGLTIEFIPLGDPTILKPGGDLPVQVLFRGKPAPNLQVQMAWAPHAAKGEHKVIGRTGADGKIDIPIHTAGRWRLHAVHMEKCPDAEAADWESFWASLTFEVPAR